MLIEKKPMNSDNCKSNVFFYNNARTAFADVLKNLKKNNVTLLIPGYIGYSPKEGSGIYDPIVSLGINHIFYQLNNLLLIDTNDLLNKFSQIKGEKAVLIVHYFGYVDPNYSKICDIVHSYGGYVIEDSAHALYTEYVDNICGEYGDFVIYSLHKMLPYKDGGMLKINSNNYSFVLSESQTRMINFLEYDLRKISTIRKENSRYVENLLSNNENIQLLRKSSEYSHCTPQSYPILLKQIDRFKIYNSMNDMGYGVISLYHTMVNAITQKLFWQAYEVSKSILNLPIHQDTTVEEIESMCNALLELCDNNSYKL